ncbi:MAG: tRNA threonylcarbamoyladenosine dehydratase [Proteobacteria bacterium]|jgi:tRNA threonylcarbamoyladenosine dehydratase|nr:tRNA threonylcarbamoyladenosine dehydratase [Pseudomonadota bacterium]
MNAFERTELLVGSADYERLQQASFCLVGLGGVGSHAAEAVARCGVGHLTLIDFDEVCLSNINRQLHATHHTLGRAKTQLMAERVGAINPAAEVRVRQTRVDANNIDAVLDRPYDYLLDCIDDTEAKIDLLEACFRRRQSVIASMGAAGRMDPTRVRVSDLSLTRKDPLAKLVRDQLRQRGITEGIDCVWTDEPSEPSHLQSIDGQPKRVRGTVSWMPAIFGLVMAGAAINSILGRRLDDGRRPHLRLSPSPGKPSKKRKKELLRQGGF